MGSSFRTNVFSAGALLLSVVFAGCSGGGGNSSPIVRATVAPTSAPQSSPTPTASPIGNFGTVPAGSSETPLPADRLADSIGLNAAPPSSAPSADIATLSSRLQILGIRHLRAGIVNNEPTYDAGLTSFLTASDAKLDGITDCAGIEYDPTSPTSASDIQNFDASIGNRLEAVEGPDEIDIRNDANYVHDTLACLPNLRAAEPSLPFYAPTLADQVHDATILGNISSYIDYGNAHRYLAGRNPNTTGYGGTFACGVYPTIAWALCTTAINSGTKPIVITETGYNSASEVDEATQAKYLSRLFFVNLGAGVSRSYVYTFLDGVGAPGFTNDGLLRTDFSQKPSYYAVENELAAFADPGQSVTQSPLNYAIGGAGKTIEHLLFKKGDGTYILAIWNEAVSWNVATSSQVVIPAQLITVTTVSTPAGVSARSLTDTGSFVTTSVSTVNDSMSFSVDDHVTLLSFKAS